MALGHLICNIQLLEEDNCNGNTVAILKLSCPYFSSSPIFIHLDTGI